MRGDPIYFCDIEFQNSQLTQLYLRIQRISLMKIILSPEIPHKNEAFCILLLWCQDIPNTENSHLDTFLDSNSHI
jgi:hypothetical protein